MKRWCWLIVLVVSLSCASVPLKVQATRGLQTSEAALGAAQDFERALCFVQPQTERGNHCTNPVAATVKLTDDLHVQFAKQFSAAFDAPYWCEQLTTVVGYAKRFAGWERPAAEALAAEPKAGAA